MYKNHRSSGPELQLNLKNAIVKNGKLEND